MPIVNNSDIADLCCITDLNEAVDSLRAATSNGIATDASLNTRINMLVERVAKLEQPATPPGHTTLSSKLYEALKAERLKSKDLQEQLTAATDGTALGAALSEKNAQHWYNESQRWETKYDECNAKLQKSEDEGDDWCSKYHLAAAEAKKHDERADEWERRFNALQRDVEGTCRVLKATREKIDSINSIINP